MKHEIRRERYHMTLWTAENRSTGEYVPDLWMNRIGRFHSYGGFFNDMVPSLTEIHLIEGGKGSFEVGGRTILPVPGSIVALFPGTPVRYRDRESSPWRYTWFSLGGESVVPVLASLGLTPDTPEMRVDFGSVSNSLLIEIEYAYAHETYSPLYPATAAWRVIDALETSIRRGNPVMADSIIELKTHLDRYHHSPGLSIGALADRIGVSRVVVCRGFKERYGTSPKEYLGCIRLEKSRRMLRNGMKTVREIAQACGYRDSRYFARVFRVHFGCTPLEFRRNGE